MLKTKFDPEKSCIINNTTRNPETLNYSSSAGAFNKAMVFDSFDIVLLKTCFRLNWITESDEAISTRVIRAKLVCLQYP